MSFVLYKISINVFYTRFVNAIKVSWPVFIVNHRHKISDNRILIIPFVIRP